MNGTDTEARKLPFRLIYHDDYDLSIGRHVFPAIKFRLIREKLLSEGFALEADFLAPEEASDEDLILVHDYGWIERLTHGTITQDEVMRLELPYSRRMVRAFLLAAGGTTLAARLALTDRVGYNIGGGFHHAFPGHGEGFCAIHDVAVAIRVLQRDGQIRRAMVIDCDVHQGNGTAAIFSGDETVLTVSLHQERNYPVLKPESDIDIHLPDGMGDDEYLALLDETLSRAYAALSPDLVMYVAGADPYFEDQLGGLALTMEGLGRRDHAVLSSAVGRGIPVVVTLAGGYAVNVEDTVAIHVQTAHEALACLVG